MSSPLADGTIASGDVIEAVHITQLFPIVAALEDGETFYRDDIGAADAYKVDFSGAGANPNEIAAYQKGQMLVFKAVNANTGASTLQVAGPSGDLAVKDLTKDGATALSAGDIQAGQMVVAVYNDEGSGRFEMIGAPTDIPAPEDGTGFYRDDEGVTDAYQVDCSGAGANPRPITAYAKGQLITFKALSSNTGPASLEVIGPSGSLSPLEITKNGGEPLAEGDIEGGQIVAVMYNDEASGRFEMVGSSAGGGGGLLFGDGSDDDVVLSSNTSLSGHQYYQNLEVQSGVSLVTNGFKIYVRDTLTLEGTIEFNGTDASDSSGATVGAAGSNQGTGLVAWDTPGGASGSLESGEAVWTHETSVFCARGGVGGGGSFGAGGDNENGNVFQDARYYGSLPAILSGVSDGPTHTNGFRVLKGGGAGAGGSGDGSIAAGGSGGGGAGVVWVAARKLVGGGELKARGGDGGDAGGTDAGGGGGGGGGVIYLLSSSSSHSYSSNVDGGNGGASGGGSGFDGDTGDSGLFLFRGGL